MNLRLVHGATAADLAPPDSGETSLGDTPSGFAIISRRLLPGSRAVIDHVLVGPPGVFAIDMKRFEGTAALIGGRLHVDGQPRNGIAQHVRKVAAAIQRALHVEFGNIGVSVTPVICVEGADVPKRGDLDGVRMLSPKALGRLLRRAPAVITRRDAEMVASVLGSRLLRA